MKSQGGNTYTYILPRNSSGWGFTSTHHKTYISFILHVPVFQELWKWKVRTIWVSEAHRSDGEQLGLTVVECGHFRFIGICKTWESIPGSCFCLLGGLAKSGGAWLGNTTTPQNIGFLLKLRYLMSALLIIFKTKLIREFLNFFAVTCTFTH